MKKCSLPLIIILACLLSFTTTSISQVQVPYFGNQHLINGYAKALRGETMSYFSAYPKYAKTALLTRCTDGNKVIEWETAIVPADIKTSYAYFTWIAAHSTWNNIADRNFDLYINDEYALTFTTHPKQYPPFWTFTGKDSTQIVFEYKTKDGGADAHGMAFLRVPMEKYKRGKPLKLKVIGQNQNSDDWYMTFKYPIKEKMDIAPLPFLLRGGLNNKQPIQFTILHFGGPGKLDLTITRGIKKQFTVQNGMNVFEVLINTVKEKTILKIKAVISDFFMLDTTVTLKPVIYREINLVHHSHTDIGYSDIQEDVVKIHIENIRKALKLIDKTKNYPEGSRFIWNIESAWAVENFLQQADKEEKRLFFTAVKNRQMVISAAYANILSGLCTPEEMNWITEYARDLRDNMGLPVNTAMMSDVPGMSWSMAPALARNGIRYFSNAPNYMDSRPDKGDRVGHTITEQGNKVFWWKSTSGKDSILMWTCGKGYSSFHGIGQGSIEERGPGKIAEYMNELDTLGYPYSMVHWRYNIVADNAPTDSTISDFVKDWNQKYRSPRLVLANVADMFERFEKRYGKIIPVLSGDFTPYWEDGAYSTAKEETDTRLAGARLLLLQKIAKQKNATINKDWLYNAKRNIIMFQEHTWGSWNSVSEPDDTFTTHQWGYKKRFADSAKYFVNKIEESFKQNTANPMQVRVVNTLSWSRSGYVEMDYPLSIKANMLADDKGNKILMQRNANGKLSFIAKDIPANGEKVYSFITENKITINPFQSSVTYNVDSVTGAIKNLNTLNKEWVNNNAFKGLLQGIYVKGLNPHNFSVSSFKKMEWVENGPACKKLSITCSMAGTNEVVYEISQFNGLDCLQLSAIIDKKAIREKESVHIAFPFALSEAQVRINIDESFITPEHGQIPGANKDFFSVQRWLDVSGKQNGVTISSPQGALFEIGSMVNEELINGYKKWKDSAQSSADIFLYAMNNYWHTNYKADQKGKVRFDFYLSFHKKFDLSKANRFGYEVIQPLTAFLL